MRTIIAICAFIGSYVACRHWIPASGGSVFNLGSWDVSAAFLVAFVVMCMSFKFMPKNK